MADLFVPTNEIIYIGEEIIEILSPNDISISKVGEKAYGLSCLPAKWTLPFIVITGNFVKKQKKLSPKLSQNIKNGIHLAFKKNPIDLIVRSSGCEEGLQERGQLYSFPGKCQDIDELLNKCLDTICSDKSITNYNIPLIIQPYISVSVEIGHLSNERRLREFRRDWVIEVDKKKQATNEYYTLGLRNWRHEIDLLEYEDINLICTAKKDLKEILRIPATWATEKKLRVHFEWLWDGNNIYILQADQETFTEGIDPTICTSKYESLGVKLCCLKPVEMEHAQQYKKIKNIFTYSKLNLPTAPLYILDDQSIIYEIANGNIPDILKNDLKNLIKNPLIIRTDLTSSSQEERQMLPRKEFRDLDSTLDWLLENSKILYEKLDSLTKIAFIFHNFIPASAAAFAYVQPKKRKVLIQSLWGLPEGLYFYSNDMYVVDTKTQSLHNIDKKDFHIETKKRYKHSFVSSDENGIWQRFPLKPPYDWKSSIPKEEWISHIALESRRIAELEDSELSIMWFVDVPTDVCEKQVFPWHHESFNLKQAAIQKKPRTKTPFDRILIIRTMDDLTNLRNETKKDDPSKIYINIEPTEDNLLRNKDILQEIGNLAKNVNATIMLEGSILSHAYYQLCQTGANVEINNSFEDIFLDEQEFNKLVRDKVPDNIENGGELVTVCKLKESSKLKALKDKLVEEVFEVLDSENNTDTIKELADVYEVLDALLDHLQISKEDLIKEKEKKLLKAGGFLDGKVLLKTGNPLPIEKLDNPALFDHHDILSNIQEMDYEKIRQNSPTIYKDLRTLTDASEYLTRITVPSTIEKWSTSLLELEDETSEFILSGKRMGNIFQFEISIFKKPLRKQLKMILK